MTPSCRYTLPVIATFILSACAAPAPQNTDPCRQYNLGMRVTPDRSWPAAVDEAERIRQRIRTASISVGTRGPEEFDRLIVEFNAALRPAITRAGACYPGSLFYEIVSRKIRDIERMRADSRDDRERWAALEAQRESREAAFAELPESVTYHRLEDAGISILSVRSNVRFTTIRLQLTNESVGRILKPVTGRLWGYDADSPDRGGIAPSGFALMDNFGNEFSLHKVTPTLTGSTDPGLHPAKSREFELVFSGYPPETASEVLLTIWRGTFGNQNEFVIRLPRSIFL